MSESTFRICPDKDCGNEKFRVQVYKDTNEIVFICTECGLAKEENHETEYITKK